ncbi:TPA: AAA family ATPase [Candidatus Bathyarchaeota archaeon]|nr:AAA family ATPase [Candidatus Bathyarchaeota archaeon]HIJ08740.1 AAA family ATPase [Candidatus Bathyarchaeota archaeon]
MSRVFTGIKGLDEMLKGGFPKGRVILLCGGPGTGKTIFSLKFVVSAAENGIPGVYASLEEPINLIAENVSSFGWNIREKEKNQRLKLLESRVMSDEDYSGREKNDVPSIVSRIFDAAKSIKAELLVIDPLTSIVISEQRAGEKRRKIAELFNQLRASGLTSVVTSETSHQTGEFFIEEFLADGIIWLEKVVRNFSLIRTIRIEKMRGIEHDEQPRRYTIDARGFTVYSTEPIVT